MSISAIGASVLGALLPSAVDLVSKTANAAANAVNKTVSAADVAAVKAADAKTRNKTTLDAIRDKGIYQWAKEQQVEKLKERVRTQVLAALGTSEGDLAKLDPKSRASTEASITQEIARRIKEAVLADLDHRAKTDPSGKQGPAIIDIKV